MNSNKLSRRSAIKKMAAVAAGVAVADRIPALASVLSPELPQDDPTVSTLQMEDFPEVYRDDDVVFHQLNPHLWVGNGHLMYNES
ncbi:MAG: hypothetical protein J6Y61_02760, partial [Bacteroidales bacterium]|nr:hypothetical protein [Bacteroidales bacterium]